VPALKSWWIMVHVISASIAYAAGAIAAIASLLYLVKAHDRMPIQRLGAGVMGVSAFLALILGRGFTLVAEQSYKVKLLREMGDQFISVGKVVDDKIVPYYVSSPGVGWLLLAMIVSCFVAAVWQVRGAYFLSCALTIAVVALIVVNDLTLLNVMVPDNIVGELVPPGPWRLGLQSNSWDLALFGIILIGQLFVGSAMLWPRQVRDLLPDSAKLDSVAYGNIMVAFALVAVVLVTGALWAHYAWGRYWGWDPKETGALVIWITYALYLHTRVTYGWTGTRSAVIGIFGFFVILAGFLGVNLGWFADGLHSYGSG
jgi:ABC-type transport system involved in cytochrome c biogenesis permease subunit